MKIILSKIINGIIIYKECDSFYFKNFEKTTRIANTTSSYKYL